jgi:hypothetical protein
MNPAFFIPILIVLYLLVFKPKRTTQKRVERKKGLQEMRYERTRKPKR